MMMIRSLQPSSLLHQMPIEMMFEIFAAIEPPPVSEDITVTLRYDRSFIVDFL
jgi:hypothetical protein